MTELRLLPNWTIGMVSLLCAAGLIVFLGSCGKAPDSLALSEEASLWQGLESSTKRKHETLAQVAVRDTTQYRSTLNGARERTAVSSKQAANDPGEQGLVGAEAASGDLSTDDPSTRLYRDAQAALRSGDEEAAIKLFRELEDNYPYLDLGRQAQLGVAYALYLEGEYKESIEELDRFIEYHPVDKNIDYAYYLKATSYYRQIPGQGRDSRNGMLAFDALDLFLRRFPDSRYADDAFVMARDVANILAADHLSIGRFYQDRGELLAAINRFQLVVRKFPDTTQMPEALHRLVECFTALGVIDEAQRTAQALASGYSGSDWTEETQTLLSSIGLYQDGPNDLVQVAGTGPNKYAKEQPTTQSEALRDLLSKLSYNSADYFMSSEAENPVLIAAAVLQSANNVPDSNRSHLDLTVPEILAGTNISFDIVEGQRSGPVTDHQVASDSTALERQVAGNSVPDLSGATSRGFNFRGSPYSASSSELSLLQRWDQKANNLMPGGTNTVIEGHDGEVGYSLAFEGATSEERPDRGVGLNAANEWDQSFAVRGELSWNRLANLQFKNQLVEQRSQEEEEYIGSFLINSEPDKWQQNRISSSDISVGLFDDRLTSSTVLNTSRYTDSDLGGEYIAGYKLFQRMDLDVWRGEDARFSIFGAYGQVDKDYNDLALDDDDKIHKKEDPFSETGQSGTRFGGAFELGPVDLALAQTDSWDAENSNGSQKIEYETTFGLDVNRLKDFADGRLGETFWNIAPDYVYAGYAIGAVDPGSGAATEDHTTDISAGANWNWDSGYSYLSYWYSRYDNRQPGLQDDDWAGDGLDLGGGIWWGNRWSFDGWLSLSRSEQTGEWSEATDVSLGGGLSMSYKPDELPDLTVSVSSDHHRGDYIASNGRIESGSWVFTSELDFTKYWAEFWAPRPANLGMVFQVRNDSSLEKWGGSVEQGSDTEYFVGLTMSIGFGEQPGLKSRE